MTTFNPNTKAKRQRKAKTYEELYAAAAVAYANRIKAVEAQVKGGADKDQADARIMELTTEFFKETAALRDAESKRILTELAKLRTAETFNLKERIDAKNAENDELRLEIARIKTSRGLEEDLAAAA